MYSVQLQGLAMYKIDRGPSHLFDFIALSEVIQISSRVKRYAEYTRSGRSECNFAQLRIYHASHALCVASVKRRDGGVSTPRVVHSISQVDASAAASLGYRR